MAIAKVSSWDQISLADAQSKGGCSSKDLAAFMPDACRAGSGEAARGTVHAGFNLSAASFLYFTLVFFLNLCVFTYFGQFLVFLTPSQGMANIVASGEP